MFSSTLRRSAITAGVLVATGAMVLSTAAVATAAPQPARQASARALTLSLGGSGVLRTPVVTAIRTDGPRVTKSSQGQAVLPQQSLVQVGVATAKAIAGTQRSFACSGLVGEGGTISVGGEGLDCAAVSPGSGGVVLDLGSVTSALPIGIGDVRLAFSSITANALFENGTTSGIARVNNLSVSVCVGVAVAGNCVGSLVKVPVVLKGTRSENVVAAIIASLTKSPQLGALLTPLTSLLKQAVSLQTNVQRRTTDGVLTVIGLQLSLLQRQGAVSNIATASAGPYTAS